jgi:GNAT superfamily N-acetyltransferase
MQLIDLFEAAGRIEPIHHDDHPQVMQMMVATFKGHGMSDDMIIGYTNHVTNWNLSKKLVIDGKLVGFYLFADAIPIKEKVAGCELHADLEQFEGLHGIEGVALVVAPEYRGSGLGNQLKDLPRTMGYDYVYGEQLKSLNNLNDWLKRRQLVANCGNVWVTAEIFK